MFEAVHNYFLENVIANRTMVTDKQWDEVVILLLNCPLWKRFRCLLQQPEEDCTLQGALVKVCVSSTLQDLAKRNSTEDREKFFEVFKEKEYAAKLTKVKAVKKETKEKATNPKGKGKQHETAPTRSSTKRSKQAQAHLPDDENKVYLHIDEFTSSEEKAEKPRDKLRIDCRASDIKAEKTGTCWRKPTKRKGSESVEVTDNTADDNDDNVDDDDDKEGEVKAGGSSARGRSSKGAQKDDNDGNDDDGDDDEVQEEDDDMEDEEEEKEKEEEDALRTKKTKTP
ncbi:hypothetical protein P167DRAFT_579338 [Morchella conica CCBAS932]|uniref:Uncharacterized protein n=1 Tax=Morchella conica CCBAS932 TaxID=1392247 RepID=A0A3N4KA06_9PEZI|nr:hypothetical protein P167DRAFT_579338 [Morchella conica CCBAS932]